MGDGGVNTTVDVVRGRLSDDRAAAVMRFWADNRALDEDAARRRLPEVVCVLLDDHGEVAGVNSAYPSAVPLIGGRRFWIYRSLLPGNANRAGPSMLSAAFERLGAEFDAAADEPLGLCVIGGRPDCPEAVWSQPTLVYAGRLDDGRDVRVAYFPGAKVSPVPHTGPTTPPGGNVYPLEDGYRIEPFTGQGNVDERSVIDLWTRERALHADEAKRRVREAQLVATDEDEPVGISTVYLRRNEQLGLDLWHFRAFVAETHRTSSVAANLVIAGAEHLEKRFVAGHDARGSGVLHETEHEGLKRHLDDAVWLPVGLTFIGENRDGGHLRVRYFPGATVPR